MAPQKTGVNIKDVKPRLGIYYSEKGKDNEVKLMVEAAVRYFKNAGWDVTAAPAGIATEAVVTYCKMAQSTDPSLLTNHPVLTSFIVQGRAGKSDNV